MEDRFFGPASGLVLLSGIGLVITSEAFGWSDTFVLIGLGAFLIGGSSVPRSAAGTASAWPRRTSTGSGVGGALKSWRRGTVWDFVILAVVIWAMITKLGA